MTPVSLVVVVSGIMLAVLAAVYRVEEARHRRFGESVRSWCDVQLARLIAWFQAGVWQQYALFIRWLGYRLVHILLKRSVRLGRRLVAMLEATLQRNRLKAKRLADNDASSYFSSLQQHKQENVLSEAERQKLKRLH
jgi:hypothetical protein